MTKKTTHRKKSKRKSKSNGWPDWQCQIFPRSLSGYCLGKTSNSCHCLRTKSRFRWDWAACHEWYAAPSCRGCCEYTTTPRGRPRASAAEHNHHVVMPGWWRGVAAMHFIPSTKLPYVEPG